jgi:hypothetical protein
MGQTEADVGGGLKQNALEIHVLVGEDNTRRPQRAKVASDGAVERRRVVVREQFAFELLEDASTLPRGQRPMSAGVSLHLKFDRGFLIRHLVSFRP